MRIRVTTRADLFEKRKQEHIERGYRIEDALLEETHKSPLEFLSRHLRGDWGDLDQEDRTENELSLKYGFRLLSSYQVTETEKLWVITEADRSVTTLLLPEEY